MPAIKNWKTLNRTTYKYRPDGDVLAGLEPVNGEADSGKHLDWVGYLYYGGTKIEEIVPAGAAKTEGRSQLTDWLKTNPEIDIDELIESFNSKVSKSVGADTDRPPGACVYYQSCGNMTPGGEKSGNQMCDTCLDRVRRSEQQAV